MLNTGENLFSPRKCCIFAYDKSSFQSLGCTFQSLGCIYKTIECTFQSFERNF